MREQYFHLEETTTWKSLSLSSHSAKSSLSLDVVSYNKCSDARMLQEMEKYLVQWAFFSFWDNIWGASLRHVEEQSGYYHVGSTQSHLMAQYDISAYNEHKH